MKKHIGICILGLLAATAAVAQTITTPPRQIHPSSETPGVDSTYQGNVLPNTTSSTVILHYASSVPVSTPTPTPTPSPVPPPPPAPVPGGTTIAGASWAFGTVDVAPVAGATSYNIGASCGPTSGPVPTTVSNVPASSLTAITTANPFDAFTPVDRANTNPTYAALPQRACLGAPGIMGTWPVQVWAQACNASGCSAWSRPVVAYCSWSRC